jgi:hypothetical protein
MKAWDPDRSMDICNHLPNLDELLFRTVMAFLPPTDGCKKHQRSRMHDYTATRNSSGRTCKSIPGEEAASSGTNRYAHQSNGPEHWYNEEFKEPGKHD